MTDPLAPISGAPAEAARRAGGIAVAFPPGAAIYRPGDPARGWIVLESGRVRVEPDRRHRPRSHALPDRGRPSPASSLPRRFLSGETMFAEAVAETDVRAQLLPAPALRAAGRRIGRVPAPRSQELRGPGRRPRGRHAGCPLPRRAAAARPAADRLGAGRPGARPPIRRWRPNSERRARWSAVCCSGWRKRGRSSPSAARSASATPSRSRRVANAERP